MLLDYNSVFPLHAADMTGIVAVSARVVFHEQNGQGLSFNGMAGIDVGFAGECGRRTGGEA